MQKSKSALFLMELIIVIFFFALTSAVCLQVFVKAHLVAKETKGLNYAVLWADNASECFYEFGDDEEKINDTLKSAFDLKDYSYILTFNKDEVFDYMTFTFYEGSLEKEIYTYTFKKSIREVAR
ncbi:MAG: hypothetical protein J6Y09_02690 [Lachnospiraceae bacterium]|nr:hypothetical protein [Lachnospiraceae bacterium]